MNIRFLIVLILVFSVSFFMSCENPIEYVIVVDSEHPELCTYCGGDGYVHYHISYSVQPPAKYPNFHTGPCNLGYMQLATDERCPRCGGDGVL